MNHDVETVTQSEISEATSQTHHFPISQSWNLIFKLQVVSVWYHVLLIQVEFGDSAQGHSLAPWNSTGILSFWPGPTPNTRLAIKIIVMMIHALWSTDLMGNIRIELQSHKRREQAWNQWEILASRKHLKNQPCQCLYDKIVFIFFLKSSVAIPSTEGCNNGSVFLFPLLPVCRSRGRMAILLFRVVFT